VLERDFDKSNKINLHVNTSETLGFSVLRNLSFCMGHHDSSASDISVYQIFWKETYYNVYHPRPLVFFYPSDLNQQSIFIPRTERYNQHLFHPRTTFIQASLW
jgi:hypothetical protein